MRVVCPFTRIHPETHLALDEYAHGWEPFYVGNTDEDYWGLLNRLWRQGEGWVNVEHDIVVAHDTVPSFAACPEPWCLSPYPRHASPQLLTSALGCVRFSGPLLAAEPDLMTVVGVRTCGLPVRHWRHLDTHVADELCERGYVAHRHEPVAHLSTVV